MLHSQLKTQKVFIVFTLTHKVLHEEL